ncbi:MAG: hypothetical protein ACI9K5_004013, partial [Gammaproteobacteria bacterium]
LSLLLCLSFALPSSTSQDSATLGRQESATGIRHSFVISGPRTVAVGETNEITWDLEGSSRFAVRLAGGNFLVVYGQHAVELTAAKEEVWRYEVSAPNTELMGGERLPNGMTLLTEMGPRPRLVEVNGEGQIAHEIPIEPETDNVHMQSRMSTKLKGGTYLVAHRLMPFAKEYDREGKVLMTMRTDGAALGGSEARNGTFSALRLSNGNTLITCTTGNKVVELDPSGKPIWVVTSAEVGGIINDVCGLQRLKNGNVVVSCYGNQGSDDIKMFEITRDKQVVWSYYAPSVRSIHTLQILSTNGIPE